jgi:hypothetical protein
MSTKAGSRILARKTIVKHIETGITITVDNSDIPIDQPYKSHKQQRDMALQLMTIKLGVPVEPSECAFDFKVNQV